MKKIIVIVGPTAVGKTDLSLALAKHYNGEIINADSMQIYRGLDIGTAKVTKSEMNEVPHHLLDIKNVEEEYSIYHYQKDCRKKIAEIFDKNKVPILVGGTGLYIKAALYDYQLEEKKLDNSSYETFSTEELWSKLTKNDPQVINKIDSHNRRRIINALQYYETNHNSITNNKTTTLLYDATFIGLTTDRDLLYQKINQRVEQMMQKGLLEEVKKFYQQKITSKPLTGGIGYKELYSYLNGEKNLEEAILEIQRNSRRYAKRQYTFFKHQLPVKWFYTNYDYFQNTIDSICEYLDNIFKL